jgi:hypothetical protein
VGGWRRARRCRTRPRANFDPAALLSWIVGRSSSVVVR